MTPIEEPESYLVYFKNVKASQLEDFESILTNWPSETEESIDLALSGGGSLDSDYSDDSSEVVIETDLPDTPTFNDPLKDETISRIEKRNEADELSDLKTLLKNEKSHKTSKKIEETKSKSIRK